MTTYYPDNWVIIELNTNIDTIESDSVRKVFAGWRGNFTEGESWKLSSGITDIKVDGDTVTITNVSGSVYIVNREREFMSLYMSSIYKGWMDTVPENATAEILKINDILEEETNSFTLLQK